MQPTSPVCAGVVVTSSMCAGAAVTSSVCGGVEVTSSVCGGVEITSTVCGCVEVGNAVHVFSIWKCCSHVFSMWRCCSHVFGVCRCCLQYVDTLQLVVHSSSSVCSGSAIGQSGSPVIVRTPYRPIVRTPYRPTAERHTDQHHAVCRTTAFSTRQQGLIKLHDVNNRPINPWPKPPGMAGRLRDRPDPIQRPSPLFSHPVRFDTTGYSSDPGEQSHRAVAPVGKTRMGTHFTSV